MTTINRITGNVFAISALALAVNGALYADTPTPLSEGVTINVTGTADAAVTNACTGTGPVSCPNLREAVVFANTNGNGTTHYDIINLGAGTHTLTVAGSGEDLAATGDLDINEPVNIVGAGVASTTIDGGGSGGTLQERIFTINGFAVGISELTITNGFGKHMLGGAIFNDEKSILTLANCAITNSTATWDFDFGDPLVEGDGTEEEQGSGGAIYSKDVMTIDNCVFRGNVADNRVDTGINDPDHPDDPLIAKVGNGGAINASQYTVINNSTFGSDAAIDLDSNRAINGGALFMTGGNPLEITNSTFSYNDAISGGGINNVSPSAPTTITNSTISGNHVTDSGAGIETNAIMTLTNVTIANNFKDSNNKGAGFNTGPGKQVTFRNVLLDNNMHDANTGFVESSNCGVKSPGVFNMNSQGGNVSSDATCELDLAKGDQEDATINLVALADNNTGGLPGTTLTHALVLGSAAVDTGVNVGCPNNDQRGSIRPFDASLLFTAVCDSGAFELYVERADLHIENMTAPSKVVQGDNVTIDIVVDNGDPSNTAGSAQLTTTLPAQLTYVSATPSMGACGEAGGVVTCDLGDITPAAEASVSIVATASTIKNGVIVGTSVSSTTLDPNTSNNTASVTIDIVEVTDLSLTAASATPASLVVGGTSTVSVTVLNRGPNAATGVELSGVIPALVSFVQGVGCSEAAGVVTCLVGDLANGASANVVFDVKGEAAGTASVTATVDADQVDTDPSDNSGTVNIGINVDDGGGGGFCAYNPNGRFDPMLPALLVAAMGLLGFRSRAGANRR